MKNGGAELVIAPPWPLGPDCDPECYFCIPEWRNAEGFPVPLPIDFDPKDPQWVIHTNDCKRRHKEQAV